MTETQLWMNPAVSVLVFIYNDLKRVEATPKEREVTLIDLPCIMLPYLMPQLIPTTEFFVISSLVSFETRRLVRQTPIRPCSSTLIPLSL